MSDEKDIWLYNSQGNTCGIMGVKPYSSDTKAFMTIVMGPLSISLDLTVDQLRTLASQCESAAADIEIRELSKPAA